MALLLIAWGGGHPFISLRMPSMPLTAVLGCLYFVGTEIGHPQFLKHGCILELCKVFLKRKFSKVPTMSGLAQKPLLKA